MQPAIVFNLARTLREMQDGLRALAESQAELTAALQEANEVAETLHSQIEESKRLLAEFSRLGALN